MDLDAVEVRVLGCLLEKQRTTPDQYPLTLNALRSACNQATNRDPVVEYDDRTIRDALHGLGRRRYTRLASGPGSRAPKYRHLLDEALDLGPAALAVLAVLMLRGPQTPGELRQRTERLHRFASGEALHEVLEELCRRDLVARLSRRPGQKEERYTHLLAAEAGEPPVTPQSIAAPAPSPAPAAPPIPASPPNGLEERVEQLEREVAELRSELDRLRAAG